jgi:hypothetical protein
MSWHRTRDIALARRAGRSRRRDTVPCGGVSICAGGGDARRKVKAVAMATGLPLRTNGGFRLRTFESLPFPRSQVEANLEKRRSGRSGIRASLFADHWGKPQRATHRAANRGVRHRGWRDEDRFSCSNGNKMTCWPAAPLESGLRPGPEPEGKPLLRRQVLPFRIALSERRIPVGRRLSDPSVERTQKSPIPMRSSTTRAVRRGPLLKGRI